MKMLRDALFLSWRAKRGSILAIFLVNGLLRRMRVRARIRRFRPFRIDLFGCSYFVNSWDGLLAIRPGNEPAVHSLATKIARSNSGAGVFINVGAHIGRYAFELAPYFSETIAFEPCAETYDLLERGRALHPNGGSIKISKTALSDQVGFADLLISIDESQNSIVASEHGDFQRIETVPTAALDHLLTPEQKAQICLMLIDVEGAEEQVLRGATSTLLTGSPQLIIEILADEAELRCAEFLRGLGYEGKRIDGSNWHFTKIRHD